MKHYDTLDGLRGLAALAIVAYHLSSTGLTSDIIHHGYLAVDFFFELSGLVLALAYRRRLQTDMRFVEFLLRRLVRIYPLALFGVALGTGVLLVHHFKDPAIDSPIVNIAISSAFNSVLLPSPLDTEALFHALFPGNAAIWSLCLELFLNLAWAICLHRLTRRPLAALCALAAVWLICEIAAHGDANLGATWPTAWGGVARVCFGFLFGTLVDVCGWRLPAPRSPLFGLVLGAVLSVVFVAPDLRSLNPVYDSSCIFFLFPLVIMCGMDQGSGTRSCALLGRISYPLYAIHFPLLIAAHLLWKHVGDRVPVSLFYGLTVGTCVLASYGVLRLYDEPIRRRLGAMLRARGHHEAAFSVRDRACPCSADRSPAGSSPPKGAVMADPSHPKIGF